MSPNFFQSPPNPWWVDEEEGHSYFRPRVAKGGEDSLCSPRAACMGTSLTPAWLPRDLERVRRELRRECDGMPTRGAGAAARTVWAGTCIRHTTGARATRTGTRVEREKERNYYVVKVTE